MKEISKFFRSSMSNVKAQNDDLKQNSLLSRRTRYVELPNRIKFLLVSDTETTTSACSVILRVGSMVDPKEFPGLAHLVEHMIQCGSKSFPKEDHYHQFVS